MSSQQPGAGRHRGVSQTPLVAAVVVWRRPSHRSAVKGLALAASALGVATAFAAPPSAPSYQLTAEEQAPARAVASAAVAPQLVDQYGVIGFSAVPKPRAKATTNATAPQRTTAPQRASRSANYSRVGLGALAGMSANAVAVVNEVHASFPQITTIGGYRPGDPGDHGSGHAVDIMCTTAQGDAVASHLQGMAGTLNIKYIIWKQRIWYPGGSWKPMADRGSATQNHYDHVHVSVN